MAIMTEGPAARFPEAAALAATLGQLSKSLQSDVEMTVRPHADGEGNILRQDHLVASASRASRIAAKIASLSQPLECLSKDANRDLAQLFVMSDSFVSTMRAVIAVADRHPSTIEEFYLPLGPTVQEVERSCNAIVSMINEFEKRSQ